MGEPIFVNMDGSLNDDGRKLSNWLETNIQAMEHADADTLNTYPGPLQYLFIQRRTVGMTSERYIQDFGKTYARNAWGIMRVLEDQETQAQQVEETAQQTTELAAKLEEVLAKLEAAQERIAVLEAKPESKPAPRKAKKDEAEAEVDDEGEAE